MTLDDHAFEGNVKKHRRFSQCTLVSDRDHLRTTAGGLDASQSCVSEAP